MKRIVLIVSCVGCASSYQSARVLPVGKTAATAAVTRMQLISDGDEDGAVWAGDLQLRHGIAERFDGAIRLARTPGAASTLSLLMLDPKYQLTAPSASTTISVGVPFGVAWEEAGTDFQDGVGVIAPTLLVGAQLAPTTELVVAPKVVVFVPDDGDSEVELGGSVGLRFTNAARTWAIHPELSFLLFTESGASDSVKILSFGIAVSAGN